MLRKVSLCLALVLFVLNQCGPPRFPSELNVLRLIDVFDESHILQSPLLNLTPDSQISQRAFPVRSTPLQDMGSGENPFHLKRKIKVFREYMNALFAPPESRYEIDIQLKEKSRLEFGIGLIREKNSQLEDGSEKNKLGEVRFSIMVEKENRQEVLFDHILKIPSSEEKQDLFFESLDLSAYTGNGRLFFQTSGQEGVFSFWVNPVLFTPDESRRQVILISIDTLRADHLGVYGYERDTSPNVDALASESVQFMNVYASSPWTLSSHVSLLTGLHNAHHQVYRQDQRMDSNLNTLAEYLKVNGFFCSAFTGGGFVSPVFGFAQGFDTYYERTDEVLLDQAAELCYRDAARWLENNKDRDFFLFLHTYQPHDPYACPAPYKTMFLSEGSQWSHINLTGHLGGKSGVFKPLPQDERQNIVDLYDAEIRYTDEKLIGPLVQKLKDLAIYDEVLIVFTSDHGEEFFEHGGWGHGQALYDESLKVPLLIKFPRFDYRGLKVKSIMSLVDILPTVLEVMGIKISNPATDGRSLMPFLRGRERKDRTFLADVAENILDLRLPQKVAMNEGRLKFILNKSIQKADLSFFQPPPLRIPSVQMFDLAADPQEKMNIADQKSSVASRILGRIEEIYSRAKERRPEEAVLDEELKQQLKALGYIK